MKNNFDLKKYLVENKATTQSKQLNEVDMKDRYNVPKKHGKNWEEEDKENWRKWVRSVGRKNKVKKSKVEYFIGWVDDWDESFHVFTKESVVMKEINELDKIGMFDGID